MDIQVGDRVTYKYKDENDIKINIITSNNDKAIISQNDKEILKIERPKYEVVEEKKELLTKEEKEFLKQYIKYSYYKIGSIEKNNDCIDFYYGIYACSYKFHNCFKNLENNKIYKLSELGLEE